MMQTDQTYEPVHTVEALKARGLPLKPEPTGIRYSKQERLLIRETVGALSYAEWLRRRTNATANVQARREAVTI